MHIERIDTLAEFASLREEWNDLLSASGSENIHMQHEWLWTWISSLGKGCDFLVLRIRSGGETIGFAPLKFRTVKLHGFLPYRQIVFLGHPEIDFGDFIITRNRAEVFEGIFSYLRQKCFWGEILLHNIPSISPNLPALQSVLPSTFPAYELAPQKPCYFIALENRLWSEFYRQTSKKFVQRDLNRLNNHYARLSWRVEDWSSEHVTKVLPILGKLHQASQMRKGRSSRYNEQNYLEFMNRVLTELSQKKWMRIYVLTIAEQPAAFMLGFDYRKIFYWWNTGFDPSFDKLSPTKFLLFQVLQEGFSSQRWREFNFMQGGTAYKQRWTSTFYPLLQLRLLNSRGPYGVLNNFRRRKKNLLLGQADPIAGDDRI